MRKIVAGVLAVVGLLSFTAFAEEAYIYTEFQVYTGVLNLCEGDMERLLLFDIAPVYADGALIVEGERLELATNNFLYDGAGVLLTPERCNERYLDRRVQFVVGRNGYGVKVVWLKMK